MATQRRKWSGGGTAGWLPTTTPRIVSRTANRAYGKYLRTRTPADWLSTTPGQGVTVPQGGVGPTSAPGIQDVYAHPELYGIPLAPGYGQVVPSARYPQGFKGFTGRVNYMDWLTNASAQLNQALSQLPAPFKNWLSNYPRLPQSTIPTPTVEYPAPGRPPGPSKPGYTNPFAWRRKNNSWW